MKGNVERYRFVTEEVATSLALTNGNIVKGSWRAVTGQYLLQGYLNEATRVFVPMSSVLSVAYEEEV